MRRSISIVLAMVIAASVSAQDKSNLALRLETKPNAAGGRVAVFIENVGKDAVTLRDSAIPAFKVWPWIAVKVDGKDANLISRAAFAVRMSPQEKLVAAKSRFLLGEILVVPTKATVEKDEPFVPILRVAPGEREVRIQLKESRAALNHAGDLPPATIKVNVQAREVKPVTHTYKTVGDLPIKADVYRAPGDDVRPAIVWIHGGALIVGQRSGINATQRKRYLDAGYVVVAIDYRLAPETKLRGIIEDVQDAFKWVRTEGAKKYKIDAKRIVVVGHSAGGYLTLMSGFAVEPRPQALIAFYGYGDITGDWYAKPDPFYRKTRPLVSKEDAYKAIGTKEIAEGNVKGRGDFYMYCRQNGLWPLLVTGYDPIKKPMALDRFCPLRNVSKDYPPTLLLHGDQDTDVPYQESVDMAKELKRFDVPHEFITIKGGGHGFDGKGMKDANVANAFERIEAFLKKHVQP